MAQRQPGGRPSKRLNILAHAVELAVAAGPQGFTLDALCERSGISKGGVLYHFTSVQALIVDMFIFYLSSRLPQWVDDKLVVLSTVRPDIEHLSIDDLTEILQHSPVEPLLERLVLKTLTEQPPNLAPGNVFRGTLANSNTAQKVALYAALGQRMATVLTGDKQHHKLSTVDVAPVNRECALA